MSVKEFRVSLCFMQWDDYIVLAETESEAIGIARRMYDETGVAGMEGEPHRVPEHDEANEEEAENENI